jgi:hypothetical protein
MFLAVMRTEDTLAFTGLGYVLFLVLLMIVMLLARSLEIKLLFLGLLTALLSAWIAVAGHAGETGPMLAGLEGSGTLGRVSVLLILCAVAIIVLNRWSATSETTSKGETRHV